MMFVLHSFLLSLALASQGYKLKAWFESCREKSLKDIKKFGDAYLYEPHSMDHFDPEGLQNPNYVGKNCYEMILFDYDFKPERDNEILNWFVELGMSIDKYHFQIVQTEEEMASLIRSAAAVAHSITTEDLVCIAAQKGFMELYRKLRSECRGRDVVGHIDRVSWTQSYQHSGEGVCASKAFLELCTRLGDQARELEMINVYCGLYWSECYGGLSQAERYSPVRKVETVAYTPLLAAISTSQLDMIDHIISSEMVPFSLNAERHPLEEALLSFEGTPANKKTVELLVSCGCDLGPWESIKADPDYFDRAGGIRNSLALAVLNGTDRQARLLQAFHVFLRKTGDSFDAEKVISFREKLIEDGYLPCEIKSCHKSMTYLNPEVCAYFPILL